LGQERSIGNLWANFVEVTKLNDVFLRMQQLERDQNTAMIELEVFLKGKNFSDIATCLRESDDYIDLYDFLVTNGLDLQSIFEWVNNQLEWGDYHPPTHPSGMRNDEESPSNLKDLWDDLMSIIPYSDYLFWFLEQLAINPDMQLLISRLQDQGSENVRNDLHACKAYLDYRCWFIGEGIDLVSLEEKGCSFLEWSECTSPKCG